MTTGGHAAGAARRVLMALMVVAFLVRQRQGRRGIERGREGEGEGEERRAGETLFSFSSLVLSSLLIRSAACYLSIQLCSLACASTMPVLS